VLVLLHEERPVLVLLHEERRLLVLLQGDFASPHSRE
jgi:hypothetical protein